MGSKSSTEQQQCGLEWLWSLLCSQLAATLASLELGLEKGVVQRPHSGVLQLNGLQAALQEPLAALSMATADQRLSGMLVTSETAMVSAMVNP